MPYVTSAFTIMIDFQKMSISIIRIFLLLKLFFRILLHDLFRTFSCGGIEKVIHRYIVLPAEISDLVIITVADGVCLDPYHLRVFDQILVDPDIAEYTDIAGDHLTELSDK